MIFLATAIYKSSMTTKTFYMYYLSALVSVFMTISMIPSLFYPIINLIIFTLLVSIIFFKKSISQHEPPSINNQFLALNFIESLIYPIYVFLENSIVLYGRRKEYHLLEFPNRSFISPIMNALLFIFYHRTLLTTSSVLIVIFVAAIIGCFLFYCSLHPKLFQIINTYSLCLIISYLYFINSAQNKITINISLHSNIIRRTFDIFYFIPSVSIPGIIVNCSPMLNGMHRVSLYSVFFCNIIGHYLFNSLRFINTTFADRVNIFDTINKVKLGLILSTQIVFMHYIYYHKNRALFDFSLICMFQILLFLWVHVFVIIK